MTLAMRSARTHFVIASGHPIREHCLGDLDEAADVRAVDVVHEAVLSRAVLHTRAVNSEHDPLEPFVDLFASPRQTHAVLRLLQTGYCHAARVGCLGGTEQYLV